MKLKVRPGDFRVRELLRDDYLSESGDHRVYRVTKRKLTSTEAARELAEAAGVEVGEVSMAGLKDRQGITVQHMSVPGGASVAVANPELRIEFVGAAGEALSSEHSEGNAFEINVRDLSGRDLYHLRTNLESVRRLGVPNYFDEQRFGNLTHGQGWVARELMFDRPEQALRSLLCGEGDFENAEELRFKRALDETWGNFEACRSIASRRGKHRSIFQHLLDHPGDFRGAFRYVAARIRLIHLYAYQSHVWNRAVAELVRSGLPVDERVRVESLEGALVCHASRLPDGTTLDDTFRLPGVGLEDVEDPRARNLLADVLAQEGLAEGQFEIRGVEGFALKGEDRPLFCVPRHLRVRPAESDNEYRGQSMVRLRFELPRGAYATLVVRRLLAAPVGEAAEAAPPEPGAPEQGQDRRDRPGGRGRFSGDARGERERGFGHRSRGHRGDQGGGRHRARRYEDERDRLSSAEQRGSEGGGRRGYADERGPRGGERRAHGGERRSYGGERRSYGGERHSYGGERRSHGSDRRSRGDERRPYRGERRPYEGDRRPYESDRRGTGGRRDDRYGGRREERRGDREGGRPFDRGGSRGDRRESYGRHRGDRDDRGGRDRGDFRHGSGPRGRGHGGSRGDRREWEGRRNSWDDRGARSGGYSDRGRGPRSDDRGHGRGRTDDGSRPAASDDRPIPKRRRGGDRESGGWRTRKEP